MEWLIFFINLSLTAALRVKRVQYGEPVVGRNTGYDAVRYLGVIGNYHGVPWYLLDGPGDVTLDDLLRLGTLGCGGALITPGIVQTACHCLATFDADYNKFLRRGTVDHHWESIKVVYVGVNDRYGEERSMESVNPLFSSKFIIHQKCSVIGSGHGFPITHDFGWIKISTMSTWAAGHFGVPTKGVSFAPQYTEKELAAIWNYNLNRKYAVCLTIGFGIFNPHSNALSDIMRHGWSVIMETLSCQSKTSSGWSQENVTKYTSWFCVQPFSKNSGLAQAGDSGGPITCNNYYFGVVLGGEETTSNDPISRWSTYSGIVFAPFENAINYRRAFIKTVQDYGNDSLPVSSETNRQHRSQRSQFNRTRLKYSDLSASPRIRGFEVFGVMLLALSVLLLLRQPK